MKVGIKLLTLLVMALGAVNYISADCKPINRYRCSGAGDTSWHMLDPQDQISCLNSPEGLFCRLNPQESQKLAALRAKCPSPARGVEADNGEQATNVRCSYSWSRK